MTGLLYCTRILTCFIALVFHLASLHSYFNLLHCTRILSCFIALVYYLASLHSYFILLHCTRILTCFIALVFYLASLHSYFILLYCTLASLHLYHLLSTIYNLLCTECFICIPILSISTINITLPNYPIMVWSSGSMRAHGISTNLENPNAQCRLRKVGTYPHQPRLSRDTSKLI